MNKNKIHYFVQSLKTPERLKIFEKNKKIIPDLKIFDSINGYDRKQTDRQLKKSKLKFISLDIMRVNKIKCISYGSLANFLTKVKALRYQIENNINYMCLIEDDLILNKKFPKFIKDNLHLLKKHNMLRLDRWGEGYVFSLKNAKKVLKHIKNTGIVRNIDNQLKYCCGGDIRLFHTPWKLMIETNKGDCLKTSIISDQKIKYFKKKYNE